MLDRQYWRRNALDRQELMGFPSIGKPWLKYYTEEDLKIKVPECTIYQNIYEDTMKRFL